MKFRSWNLLNNKSFLFILFQHGLSTLDIIIDRLTAYAVLFCKSLQGRNHRGSKGTCNSVAWESVVTGRNRRDSSSWSFSPAWSSSLLSEKPLLMKNTDFKRLCQGCPMKTFTFRDKKSGRFIDRTFPYSSLLSTSFENKPYTYFFGIEVLQIVHLFSVTDKFHGNIKFVADRKDNPAFGCPIELRKDDFPNTSWLL